MLHLISLQFIANLEHHVYLLTYFYRDCLWLDK